jgi:Ca2+-binding RTX toxin-like protein
MRKPSSRKFRPDMLALEGRKLMTADLTIDVSVVTDHSVNPAITNVVVDGSDYNDVIRVTNYQPGRSITFHLEQWSNNFRFSSRDQTVGLLGTTLPSPSYSPFVIHAKGGDDSIINQTAAPLTVYGNLGNDYIELGLAGGLADGGDGNDAIFGSPLGDSIIGGDGNDFIVGGDGSDVIYGGLGSDFIDGDGGNDFIDNYSYGSRPGDSDVIYGSDGNDYILGSNGNERIYGGNGNDTIYGNDGNDAINGDAGDDVIHGGGGNDVLGGDDGNDTLYGDDGQDYLYGGNGNDYLDGGNGSVDFLQGDGGADTFVWHKVVIGFDDSDRFVDFNGSQGDRVNEVWHAF